MVGKLLSWNAECLLMVSSDHMQFFIFRVQKKLQELIYTTEFSSSDIMTYFPSVIQTLKWHFCK